MIYLQGSYTIAD